MPFKTTQPVNAHISTVSAYAREGEHATQLRHQKRPRSKLPDSSDSYPMPTYMSPQPPKDVPPYRVPPNLQRDIDQGKFNTDQRFPGNRFLEVSHPAKVTILGTNDHMAILQLKAMRPSMRAHSIKHKLISDPEHRTDLTGAITVVGTCLDMCPEYERHEREFQKDVDDWEKVCIPGHG